MKHLLVKAMAIFSRYQLLLVCSIFFLIQPDVYAQTISGKVLSSQTNESIPYANVYFNNSFNGSVSDIDGNFVLNISQNPGQDIIVSCVGYQSALIEDHIPGEYYEVYLKPHTYLLDPLLVVADGTSRKKLLKRFLREFLGQTKNAKKCTIENLDDLRLEYDSSGTLVAFSSKPLIISNKALGYRITYFLDEFKHNKEVMKYGGYSLFEEDTTLSKQEIIQIIERREKAYSGSRMHFFRVLWNDEFHKSKFKLFDARKGEEVRLQDQIHTKNQDVKYLSSPNTLKIVYSISGSSVISLEKTDELYFTRNGYFDPKGIRWWGRMSKQRMADLLPYEYVPIIKDDYELAFEMQENDLEQKIVAALSKVNQVHINEKVYLHLDKYLYTLGEEIWLKAYVVDGNSQQLLPQSKVLYVEFINPQNELVSRLNLPVINGTAKGNISLSDSLEQGSYRIRAYTNHMRNYDHGSFFNKFIQILGPDTLKVEPNSISRPEILVDFFPEGGSFINGLDNTIGFKITDAYGNGIDGELQVFTNLGVPVIHAMTSHLGMGKFSIIPEDGTQYFAHVITPAGEVRNIDLPKRENKGLRLMVNSLPENKFGINILANSKLENVLLVGLSGNDIHYMSDVDLENGKANFLVPKNLFLDGIVQFTVFGDEGIPLAERLVFKKPDKGAQIKISTEKSSYQLREQVKVVLNVSGYEDIPLSGNFSIAITDQNQRIEDPQENTIISNLLLTSELKGKVEHPAYYFETNSFKALQDLDLVMLIHGWRRFTWNEILTDSIDEPTFEFEEGIAIAGKVQKYLRNQFIESGKIAMVTLSGAPQWAEVEVDSTGKFYMYPLQVYEDTEMVLQASNAKGKSNLSVELVATDYPEISKMTNTSAGMFAENSTSENITYRLKESHRRLEIDKAFERIDSITYLEEVVITGKKQSGIEYSGRSTTIDLNEIPNAHSYYNAFHLLRGRTSDVYVLGSVLNPRILVSRVKNYKGEYMSGEPLYLIDGYPVSKSQILNTPVANIETVVAARGPTIGMFGSSGQGAVIAITRKKGASKKSYRRTGVINLANVGYSVSREFFSPDYSTPKEAHAKPDFRSTLYWNPEINIDTTGTAEVSFYNGDYHTNYQVIIEGVTADGVPLRAITNFESK